MNMVNGYILYRLMVDKNEKPRRHSLMPTVYDQPQPSPLKQKFEPFCSPIAPHVPIRQRLSSRRCTSVDASNECDEFVLSASNPYLCGRRRRMSLLQTLRYQNKQLADSGFECQPSDKTEPDMTPPSGALQKRCSDSPPSSPIEEEKMQKPSRSSFSKLRAKTKALFGKKGEKESRIAEERITSSDDGSSRCCPNESERGIYSCIDFTAKEKNQRKSPSTNDSGRGSQGRLCTDEEHPDDTPGRERNERRETVAVIERPPLKAYMNEISKSGQLRRTISCPQLGLNLRIYHEICRRAISMRNRKHSFETETEDDEDDFQCSLPDVGRQVAEAESFTHHCPQSPRSEKSEEAEGIIEKEDIKFAERMLRNSSPLSAADFLLEKRLQMRALVMRRQQEASLPKELTKSHTDIGIHVSPSNRRNAPNFSAPAAESIHSMNARIAVYDIDGNDEAATKLETVALGEVDIRSVSTHASEELEEDDNTSTILDHYLPFLSELYPRRGIRSQRSSSQSSAVNNRSEGEEESNLGQGTRKVVSVTETQTDLSLIHISERLSAYLAELGVTDANDDLTNDKEGMNFLAKHFFEYQSFVNLPHKAVQLHKTPPSQAGSDPSAAWAPKSMNKAGKNQAAPGARANRNNTDTRPSAHRHGRAGRHEFREWGDRHGELKPEKIVPHKDAWTKFLSNEEGAGKRTMFECEFEDRILQTEPETLPERLSRTEKSSDIEFSVPYPGTSSSSNACETEVLTILTYAPQVQFVTATVKKAKCLPFNNRPFARVMLFEGRRLLEQKQTTITPTITCNGCVSSCARQKPPCSASSTPSSSASSGSNKSNDAIFSESFLFHVSPQMLDRCHIVIEMYDSNPEEPEKGPFPIGHCVVGPMCAGTGCAHWFQMVRKIGLPVCMWHRMTKS